MNSPLKTLGLAGGVAVLAVGSYLVAGPVSSDADADTMATDSCGARLMHLEYERTGGFAGMTMSASVEVDSLPPAERDEVCRLVDDAGFFDIPNSTGDASGADQFGYSITVEDGDRRHTVLTNDGTVPASLRPLLDWLNRAARRKSR